MRCSYELADNLELADKETSIESNCKCFGASRWICLGRKSLREGLQKLRSIPSALHASMYMHDHESAMHKKLLSRQAVLHVSIKRLLATFQEYRYHRP
eukprot:1159700-Pelagomonas_calceolata.AAC.1